MNPKNVKTIFGCHPLSRLKCVFVIVLFVLGMNAQLIGAVIFGCQSPPPELIPNGGFENHFACPTGPSQLSLAQPWFQPTVGTPDLFDACATASSVQTPANFVGYAVPHGGQAYGGGTAFTFNGTTASSSREYLETPLISPLVAGKTYQVSFYVCLASLSRFAIDNLGARFSIGTLGTSGMSGALAIIPHVRNPAGQFLTSTGTWMPITGTYTAAGGEDHLTYGNFYDDAHSPSVVVGGSIGFIYGSFYYVDDMSVTALCGCPSDKTVNGNSPWTFDTPTAYTDTCADPNVTVTILNNVTNSNCPLVITRTWVATDTCGNTNTCSQTVTVLDTPVITNNPAEIVICATNGCGIMPDATSQVQAFNSDGTVTVSQSIAPGTQVCNDTNVTFIVSDACGDPVSCTAFVNLVNCLTNCLQVDCPTNITIVSCTNVPVFYQPTVVDCCTNWNVVCSPTNGSWFSPGTTNTVYCTVTDSCGGTNSCNFKVIVLTCATSMAATWDHNNLNINWTLDWAIVGPYNWHLQSSTDLVHWVFNDITNAIPPIVISNIDNIALPAQYFRMFRTN